MSLKFRLLKVYGCILLAVLVIALWLYLIMNLKQFQLVFLILGCIFATLLAIYATVVLGIIAYEQAKPLNIVIWRDKHG
jgi:hypothetical protein